MRGTRARRVAGCAGAWLSLAVGCAVGAERAGSIASLAAYEVVGDSIPNPLSDAPADAARGRAIVVNRQAGLCLLCHSGPFPEERSQGDLAPSLQGVGARLSVAQLRLRVVDARVLNPQSLMPSFYRVERLERVAPAFAGKPLLTAGQIEDVVAFLATLQ